MPVHSQGDWQSGVMMYMQGDPQSIGTPQQGEQTFHLSRCLFSCVCYPHGVMQHSRVLKLSLNFRLRRHQCQCDAVCPRLTADSRSRNSERWEVPAAVCISRDFIIQKLFVVIHRGDKTFCFQGDFPKLCCCVFQGPEHHCTSQTVGKRHNEDSRSCKGSKVQRQSSH